jgi:hypothetical protein
MDFFDCNLYFGLPAGGALQAVGGAPELLAEMARAGVAQALVWHIAQHDASPQYGNRLLAEAIAPHPQLTGCWAILPNSAGEFPAPETFFAEMKAARVAALRLFPGPHHFLLHPLALGDWLPALSAARIPLLLSVTRGVEWRDLYTLLEASPQLTCVICDHGCWGMDRYFRPLLARFPNVYIDTAQYFLDGGLEALVNDLGYERILFGSGFPESYFGGMMLALRHAGISEAAKQAIAGGNLRRLLAEVRL